MELTLSKDRYFLTIQGEGSTIGKPSIFLRLQYCNLNCVWCDTRYTWDKRDKDFGKSMNIDVDDLVMILSNIDEVRNLVVTGGEPLLSRHQLPLLDLLTKLRQKNPSWTFEIETNGTLFPLEEFSKFEVQFNVSPKLSGSKIEYERRIVPYVLNALLKRKSIFKFVVDTEQDLVEVQELVKRFKIDPSIVYIIPEAISKDMLVRRTLDMRLPWFCTVNGFNLGTRLQTILWGNRAGV